MEIKLPVLSKLSAAQYSGVTREIKDMVMLNPLVYGKVKVYFDSDFLPSATLMPSAFGKKTKSLFTAKIVDAKDNRITKFRALRYVIKGDTQKSDANISDAAKELLAFLDGYGDFSSKSITTQTPIIEDVLIDLDGVYAPKVELLGISQEVEDLREANVSFKQYTSKREDENIKKPTSTVAELRKKLDPAIRTLCSMIDVFAISEKSTELDNFIKKLNEIFKKYGAVSTGGKSSSSSSASDKPSDDNPSGDTEEPTTPTEPVVEETHEELMAKARAWTTVGDGEWKLGDYCWHMVNSVKTYWRLIDVSKKETKPYLSGGEVAWELVS